LNRFRTKTTRRLLSTAAALLLALLVQHARAEDMNAQDMDASPDAAETADLECAGEPLSGSGPGFSSARDASEEAARAAWLEKAKAVYPEATWETAKDADVACAVQGLYSKCFAQGTPCRPKSDAAADDAAAADDGNGASDTTAAAPASEAPKSE
jgi:hypothetical protein